MEKIRKNIEKYPWLMNLGWGLALLPALVLSQLPLLTIVLGLRQSLSPMVINSLTLMVTVLVVGLFLWCLGKTKIGKLQPSVIGWRELGRNGLYLLLILVNNAVGTSILRQTGALTTDNQQTINQLQLEAPLFAMGLAIVVVAPIVEEIICRGIIPRLFFKGAEKWGYLVGAIFFAYLHGPTNVGSWWIYGGMSLIMTWVAYRYERLEYSILLHMTLNGLGYLLTLLVVLFPVQ